MKEKMVLIIVVAVIIAVVIGLILLTLESCEVGPPYEVGSTRLSQEPQQYIVLDSTQIQLYPIIGDVIDAFDNPEDHPNAEFINGMLYYAVYDEGAVTEAREYIVQRYRSEFSSPDFGSLNIAYDKGDGQGMQYYTWAVFAIDYALPFYCT
ncbi:MAG: hypothetical protein KAR39_12085 [Thermoplasmata archaeon]|nr:hypothetical protein [Thermoplasmata archaeon]